MAAFVIPVLAFILLVVGCGKTGRQSPPTEGPYLEDWQSLSRHNEEPEWFKDAKFGIYFHWGVYSVPAFGTEWYPRQMHFEGDPVYQHHLEHYGHPSEFGYHDFVPMFGAEHFDPGEWADLFARAGARFAGPVAEHHDGFAMWDSDATPWNSKEKGPRRDITGELEKTIRERGLKFICTFHHARNLQRYKGKEEEVITREKIRHYQFRKSHYPLFPGMPPTLDDPERNYLYGNIPEAQWLEDVWYAKLAEVVDRYRPDLVYFDSWLNHIPDSMRLKFCAYYLNRAHERGQEVVIVRKQHDLPLDCSVDDLEKTRKNQLEEKAWMTDETISTGSWSYTTDLKIRESRDLLHVLLDIVSKNGVLLLNISPRADGTIPGDQQQVLLDMGEWLGRYGEAIYETRPWYTFGEGPTKEPEGDHLHNQYRKLKYTARDVRYTTKGKSIYAIFLGNPAAEKNIILQAFSSGIAGREIKVEKITIAGTDLEVDWTLTEGGLELWLPDSGLDEKAVALKIDTRD